MIRRHLAAFCFVFLGAALSQACGQGDGQVCQQPGDCASGLDCLCRIGTGTRGLCRAPGSTMCTSGTADTGPRVDANIVSAPDADVDANDSVDANTDANVDANVSVDANTVDSNVDANASDAGSDGGSDASFDANADANADAG